MMTSKFAYILELDTTLGCSSSRERDGYVLSWWSKRLDIPQERWDVRTPYGKGWYRYTKVIPYVDKLRLEDIPWPDGDLFNRQVSWDDNYRKPYIKAGRKQ